MYFGPDSRGVTKSEQAKRGPVTPFGGPRRPGRLNYAAWRDVVMLAADPELPTLDLFAFRCIVVKRRDRTGRGQLLGRNRASLEPAFVPKMCLTQAHSGAFWITRGLHDRLRSVFGGTILRALEGIVS